MYIHSPASRPRSQQRPPPALMGRCRCRRRHRARLCVLGGSSANLMRKWHDCNRRGETAVGTVVVRRRQLRPSSQNVSDAYTTYAGQWTVVVDIDVLARVLLRDLSPAWRVSLRIPSPPRAPRLVFRCRRRVTHRNRCCRAADGRSDGPGNRPARWLR